MTPAAVLAAARESGLSVRIDCGIIKVEGPTAALARWVPELRAVKPALVELLSEPDSPPRRLWLIRHAADRLESHSFTPPAALAEVRGWYPLALSIQPEPESTP